MWLKYAYFSPDKNEFNPKGSFMILIVGFPIAKLLFQSKSGGK